MGSPSYLNSAFAQLDKALHSQIGQTGSPRLCWRSAQLTSHCFTLLPPRFQRWNLKAKKCAATAKFHHLLPTFFTSWAPPFFCPPFFWFWAPPFFWFSAPPFFTSWVGLPSFFTSADEMHVLHYVLRTQRWGKHLGAVLWSALFLQMMSDKTVDVPSELLTLHCQIVAPCSLTSHL